jgi:hypothetical protein
LLNQSAVMQQGQTHTISVFVPPYADMATFVVSWPGSRVDTILRTPDGWEINPNTPHPLVSHAKEGTFELYQVQYPSSGVWQLIAYGAEIEAGGEPVTFQVDALVSLHQVFLPLIHIPPIAIAGTPTLVPPDPSTPTPIPSSSPTTISTSTPTSPLIPTSSPTHTPTNTPTRTSTATNTPTVTPGLPPAAPSTLQATAPSASQIHLTWTDNAHDEIGFAISDGDTFFTTVNANTTAYTVEGLAPNSYHCYYVYAFNDHGPSASTNWACTTTNPLPPLPAPIFVYPVDGQSIGYEGHYLFEVQPIDGADGFLWGFFQGGVLIWENLRDEGSLSSNTYAIYAGTEAHSRFSPGAVEVWVRASRNGVFYDAAVITIYLQPLIANGDFEQGQVAWSESTTLPYPLITTIFPGSLTPYSGSWAAWLGGGDNEISILSQQVEVSQVAPYLSYWHWIASEDSCGFDSGGVSINGQVVETYWLCGDTNTNGWVRRVVDLSGYVGQVVTLSITVSTDGSLNSNLFIDDVSFQFSSTLQTGIPPQSNVDRANTFPKGPLR